jgi:hypothetical protein
LKILRGDILGSGFRTLRVFSMRFLDFLAFYLLSTDEIVSWNRIEKAHNLYLTKIEGGAGDA